MKILVTGSRNWQDRRTIENAIVVEGAGLSFVLMHGGCPTGADAMTQQIADSWEVPCEIYHADWARHGKAAGPIRNQQMIDAKPDIVLAFLMPGSKGTQDCIRRAEKAGIECKVYEGR